MVLAGVVVPFSLELLEHSVLVSEVGGLFRFFDFLSLRRARLF